MLKWQLKYHIEQLWVSMAKDLIPSNNLLSIHQININNTNKHPKLASSTENKVESYELTKASSWENENPSPIKWSYRTPTGSLNHIHLFPTQLHAFFIITTDFLLWPYFIKYFWEFMRNWVVLNCNAVNLLKTCN